MNLRDIVLEPADSEALRIDSVSLTHGAGRDTTRSASNLDRKDPLRILNLNTSPGFEDNDLWQSTSILISGLDPLWHERSLFGKAWKLVNVSRGFDVILFHLDLRLAALYGLLRVVVPLKQCLVFESFLCDVSRYSSNYGSITTTLRSKASLLMHRLLVRTMNALFVHTRAEIDLYSKFFAVPRSRFVFVPYFHYGDALDYPSARGVTEEPDQERASILAIGRHRDFDCFIRALTGSPWNGLIVAGDSDRQELSGRTLPNITIHYEVSRSEYRDYIANSTIVVIPLFADRWQRALGQIAMFEAMLMGKPVIGAQTFQLSDYASDDEILFYRPGDACHLREQISRLLEDSDLRSRLTQNARRRTLTEFTRDKHIAGLVSSIAGVCDMAPPLQETE